MNKHQLPLDTVLRAISRHYVIEPSQLLREAVLHLQEALLTYGFSHLGVAK